MGKTSYRFEGRLTAVKSGALGEHGNAYVVGWKRGSNSGSGDVVSAHDHALECKVCMDFLTSLEKDKSGMWKPKYLTVVVSAVVGKGKTKEVGKTDIQISKFMEGSNAADAFADLKGYVHNFRMNGEHAQCFLDCIMYPENRKPSSLALSEPSDPRYAYGERRETATVSSMEASAVGVGGGDGDTVARLREMMNENETQFAMQLSELQSELEAAQRGQSGSADGSFVEELTAANRTLTVERDEARRELEALKVELSQLKASASFPRQQTVESAQSTPWEADFSVPQSASPTFDPSWANGLDGPPPQQEAPPEPATFPQQSPLFEGSPTFNTLPTADQGPSPDFPQPTTNASLFAPSFAPPPVAELPPAADKQPSAFDEPQPLGPDDLPAQPLFGAASQPPSQMPLFNTPPAFGAPPSQPPAFEAPPAFDSQPPAEAPPAFDAPPAQAPSFFEAPPAQAPAFDAPPLQNTSTAPAFDAPPAQAPAFDAPPAQAPAFDPPAQAPIFDAPPVQPASEAPPSGLPAFDAPPAQAPSFEAPAFDAQPASEAPPAFDAPPVEQAPSFDAPPAQVSTLDAPPVQPAPPAFDAPPAGAPAFDAFNSEPPAFEVPAQAPFDAPPAGEAPLPPAPEGSPLPPEGVVMHDVKFENTFAEAEAVDIGGFWGEYCAERTWLRAVCKAEDVLLDTECVKVQVEGVVLTEPVMQGDGEVHLYGEVKVGVVAKVDLKEVETRLQQAAPVKTVAEPDEAIQVPIQYQVMEQPVNQVAAGGCTSLVFKTRIASPTVKRLSFDMKFTKGEGEVVTESLVMPLHYAQWCRAGEGYKDEASFDKKFSELSCTSRAVSARFGDNPNAQPDYAAAILKSCLNCAVTSSSCESVITILVGTSLGENTHALCKFILDTETSSVIAATAGTTQEFANTIRHILLGFILP